MSATYARLTNRQKVELRAHRIERPDLRHKQLAEWAMIAFKLPRAPSRMTIHHVVKAQDDNALRPEHKANRSVCCPELEEEVLQWIRSCEEWRVPIVTGATIRKKASAIRERMLVAASPAAAKILTPPVALQRLAVPISEAAPPHIQVYPRRGGVSQDRKR